MEREVVDLYTLQQDMKGALGDLFPDRIWVRSEIAQLNVRSTGHCYMDLVQSENGRVIAKVRGIIWGGYFPLLNAKFRAATGKEISSGTEVLVRAAVNFHEVYGLSLVIDDIDASFTIGAQQLKRQQTIEKLTNEGLLDRQKGLRLNDLPYNLAIISAEGAAGLQDFRRHLLGNAYGFAYRLDLFPALMQGEGAAGSICDALSAIGACSVRYDAVLLLRGGGADMDLVCFDDYDLAAAIARFPVPVITAIGHDKDFHVADMAAYDHVKTPTALADMFIGLTAAADERISSFGNRLAMAFGHRLDSIEARTSMAEKDIRNAVDRRLHIAETSGLLLGQRISSGVDRRLDSAFSQLSRMELGVRAGVASRLAAAESKLSIIESGIKATDPRNVLSRGFSLALDSRGVRLKSAAGSKEGDRIAVQFADGRLDATVDGIRLTRNE